MTDTLSPAQRWVLWNTHAEVCGMIAGPNNPSRPDRFPPEPERADADESQEPGE